MYTLYIYYMYDLTGWVWESERVLSRKTGWLKGNPIPLSPE